MLSPLWLRLKVISVVFLLLITVHILNIVLDGQLGQYGVIPRTTGSLLHIFTAPFIHGNVGHLLNNLVGIAVFSAFCLVRSIRFYLASSLFIIIVSGILIWIFGRTASHIGASGWIFGLWSLSIAIAWFDRRFINIAIAFLVLFFYGGMIYGVLPSDPGISFEAHLFGAASGVICAFLYIFMFTNNNVNLSKKI